MNKAPPNPALPNGTLQHSSQLVDNVVRVQVVAAYSTKHMPELPLDLLFIEVKNALTAWALQTVLSVRTCQCSSGGGWLQFV